MSLILIYICQNNANEKYFSYRRFGFIGSNLIKTLVEKGLKRYLSR